MNKSHSQESRFECYACYFIIIIIIYSLRIFHISDSWMVWFGLVSLFNGISTVVGYLMPKPSFLKNSSGTI